MFDGQTLDLRTKLNGLTPHLSSLFPKQREEMEGGACPSFIDTRQLQVGKTFSLSKCGTRIRAQASRTTLALITMGSDDGGQAHAAAIAAV